MGDNVEWNVKFVKGGLEQGKVAKNKVDAARTPIMSNVVLGAKNEKSEQRYTNTLGVTRSLRKCPIITD